jgi:2-oxoglutarate dehydrogenase complex dehydrogenase (E1) component-like enzyme
MNKERYNQIIDEVYERYCKDIRRMLQSWDTKYDKVLETEDDGCRPYTKQEFIRRSKTDQEFSDKWG